MKPILLAFILFWIRRGIFWIPIQPRKASMLNPIEALRYELKIFSPDALWYKP